MILPKHHHVSQLIVRHCRKSAPHSGREQTLCELRRVFWIIIAGRLLGAALRWPNTVFARVFADVIQRAHKDCKNKNFVNRAIILFIQNPHFLCYFSLLLNAVY